MPDAILSDHCLVSEPILLNRPAPDFMAEAYSRGDRIDLRLSDIREPWVVLFFYASDFTFV